MDSQQQPVQQPIQQSAEQPVQQPEQQPVPQPVQRPVPQMAQETEFGPDKERVIICPNCKQEVLSNIHHESGLLSYGLCMCLCLFTWMCCLCLLPLFMKCTRDVIHTCPRCGYVLGRYKRC